jgi:hypothetical protein
MKECSTSTEPSPSRGGPSKLALVADPPSGPVCESDAEGLAQVITLIRNVHTLPEDRQPLKFEIGERRTATRVPLTVLLQVTPAVLVKDQPRSAGESFPAESIDISLNGMAFSHSDPLRGFHLLLSLKLPTSDFITVLAEVMWTLFHCGKARTGVRFVRLIEHWAA